jgi:RNA-directed DNA polymerase
VEADIEACFDMIDHFAVMGRVRARIGDKPVLALVKGFLKAGVISTTGSIEGTITGTPQGGILSPLLADIALSVLDTSSLAAGPNRWRPRCSGSSADARARRTTA